MLNSFIKNMLSNVKPLSISIVDDEVIVKTMDGRVGRAKYDPINSDDVLDAFRAAIDDAKTCVILTDKEKKILTFLKDMGCDSFRIYREDEIKAIYGYNDKNINILDLDFVDEGYFNSLSDEESYSIQDLLDRD